MAGLGENRYFDDLYFCDGSGSRNNDFLGDMKVETIFPSGNGNSNDWSSSSGGDNYTNVDENPPNDDTDYNYSTLSGNIDTFAFENLTTVSGSINGIQLNILARKDDAGTKIVKQVIRRGSVDYVIENPHYMADAYAYYVDIVEEDPSTSSDWTITGINAAEFGYKDAG